MMLQGRPGKVVQVYRKRWVIHIERLTQEKVNGVPCACFCSLKVVELEAGKGSDMLPWPTGPQKQVLRTR
jgi:hypothetical protein